MNCPKKCYETDCRLGLFKETNTLASNEYDRLFSQCSKLRKLLIAAIAIPVRYWLLMLLV